jgi:hypothetical protein
MLAVTKFNLVPVLLVLLALALVPVPLLPPHLLAERAGRALGFGWETAYLVTAVTLQIVFTLPRGAGGACGKPSSNYTVAIGSDRDYSDRCGRTGINHPLSEGRAPATLGQRLLHFHGTDLGMRSLSVIGNSKHLARFRVRQALIVVGPHAAILPRGHNTTCPWGSRVTPQLSKQSSQSQTFFIWRRSESGCLIWNTKSLPSLILRHLVEQRGAPHLAT